MSNDKDGGERCRTPCKETLLDVMNRYFEEHNEEIVEIIATKQEEAEESVDSAAKIAGDIKSLKKKIKYAKNPLERKAAERQLNMIYKQRKQSKRKEKR